VYHASVVDRDFTNFNPPTPTLSPQTPHRLNHRRWCHLANTLKTTVNKRTAKISIHTWRGYT